MYNEKTCKYIVVASNLVSQLMCTRMLGNGPCGLASNLVSQLICTGPCGLMGTKEVELQYGELTLLSALRILQATNGSTPALQECYQHTIWYMGYGSGRQAQMSIFAHLRVQW